MIFDSPKTVAATIQNFTGRTWLLPVVLKWFEQTDDRLFILKGEPGTGKSMVVAWLAGAGPSPANPELRSQLERIRSGVKAAHFCLAKSGNTAPKAFAQNLAEQLTRNVKGFGDALAATLADRVQIVSEQHVSTVQSGASVTGVNIGRLDLGALGDELSFDRSLREPFKKLYVDGYNEPMIMLVDALDEARTYTGSINIVQLLAKLTDLPDPIRFLVTTRPDPVVLYLHHEVAPFDLIKDAPKDADDVHLYAYERLAVLDDERRSSLADRIGKAAEGNFLYTHFILNDLLQRLSNIPDLEAMPLPEGLSGLYHDFLNRELGANRGRWFNTFKPLFGLIAVAQGEGLSRTQIECITGQDVEEALEVSRQYLDGDWPAGPFRPFHQSFADFLLEDKGNIAYHIDATRAHRQIVDYYWTLQNGAGPWQEWDDYGLRYIATHLAEATRRSSQPELHQLIERLVKLVVNPAFQQIHKERLKDLAALQRDLEQAFRSAVTDNDPRALPLVVEIALALIIFRKEQLRPEPLFDLALRGEVEAAARRLDLFNVDLEWRQAVLLTIAWLASERNPGAARKLRDRLRKDLPVTGPLPLLLERLNATLEGTPSPVLELPPAPPPEYARELVARIGGLGQDVELLVTQGLVTLVQPGEMLAETGYLAAQDGPSLVAYAAAHSQEGDQYFKQYVATHRAYNYVQYRNNSLWLLLGAALRHPEQKWVQDMVSELAKAALAGNTLEFQEGLPLTLLALQGLAGKPDALQALEQRRDRVMADAKRLRPGRGLGDAWGSYKRLLAALAQVFALLLDRKADADALFDLALSLPYGFAGFQSPACLTLAEAIHVCHPDDTLRISAALQAAQRAAHNIQDSMFCARTTGRFNAMVSRWWRTPPVGFDVAVARRLCQTPDAPEFAALHIVGESYLFREWGPDKMPLPGWVLGANTLETLANLYQRPLVEFQRLNREQGWAKDDPLPEGTWVNIPGAELAPLLAARFAAEALIEPTLTDHERVELIQSLLPTADTNPTALDTILTRLLLASRPSDIAILDALEQIAERLITEGSSE